MLCLAHPQHTIVAFFRGAGLGCSSTYWPLDVICDLVSLLKKFWLLSKLQQ